MIARRIALPILALLVSAVAPGNRTRTLAPVIPEIYKHLDEAESCLGKGHAHEAMAHCDVVLVAEQIAVAIQYLNVPNGQRGACERAVEQATEAWENALQGRIRFRMVESSAKAQVVVVFKSTVLLKGEPVAGLLNWKRTIQNQGSPTPTGQFSSEMLVRTSLPDGREMPSDAIRHTVTHEMGHVFGLEDTDRIGELMGPLNMQSPLTGPMAHEIDAVQTVRAQALQIREQAQRQITE